MSGWRIAGLVCFAAALVEGWQGQTSAAVGMMVLAIGCAGVALARRPRTQTQRIAALSAEQLAAVPAEEQALATELYEKAQRDYLAVEQARHAVKDERLAQSLAALQPVSARIMGYLRQHPEKIALARKFIDYYQDRAAQLAAEYQELEATGLVTPQVEETKRHIREVVASFGQVYTASFEKLLTDKLLDVDAELKVMEQTLDAEGIERVPEAQTADEASPEEQAQAGEPAAAGAALAAGEAVPPGGAPQTAGATPQAPQGAPWQRHPGCGRGRRLARRLPEERTVIPVPLEADVRRQRIVMSVLAILLGTFGAHKFFQGRIGMGILYMVFCGTGIPTIVGLCEGIRYATMPLERFYEKVYRPC